MTYEYTLTMVKGCEMSIEYLLSDDPDDNEFVETGFDAYSSRLYLAGEDGEEMEIDTDWSDRPVEDHTPIDEARGEYVKSLQWRTTEWDVWSEKPLTADSVVLVKRAFGDCEFLEPTIPDAQMEFNSSWDGRSVDILEGEQVYVEPADD